jgi:hypothetical protein
MLVSTDHDFAETYARMTAGETLEQLGIAGKWHWRTHMIVVTFLLKEFGLLRQ